MEGKMGYAINDETLITEILDNFSRVVEKEEKISSSFFFHPLDKEIMNHLRMLKPSSSNSIDYSQISKLDELWVSLIDKSVTCLRYFDEREPFKGNPNKVAVTYGLEKLQKYHERYTNFEGLLYGSSSYYRDHIFHAIRTWMLGIFCLIKDIQTNKETLIEHIGKEAGDGQEFISDMKFFEKISMWTIIALCHDLGYPLEKSQQILDKTREMMKEFIPNPNIWNNFGFSGTQDSINDYIVKFMSTKMKRNDEQTVEYYLGRIQPKYYLKYAKSLERYDHGIVSAVILYKMLLFFLESDFNLNDDYRYDICDAKQFYVRREILRAMSSHTCADIYNVHLTTFSSLLFFCDELQEWGRKSWNSLYAGLQPEAINLTIENFSQHEIIVHEKICMESITDDNVIVRNIAQMFLEQYSKYRLIFRDGQYTAIRTFGFTKKISIILCKTASATNTIIIEFALKANEENYFSVSILDAPKLTNEFYDKINKELKNSVYKKDLKFSLK